MNDVRSNLYAQLKKLWSHITRRRRVQIGLLLVLIILSSFAEVISIGAVLPFLGVLTSPELVFNHQLSQPVIRFLNIKSPHDLLLPLTIAFSIAVLLSGAMRFVTLWAQTRLSFAIGADLSISIYRRTLYQPYSVHVSRNSSEVIASISTKVNSVIAYVIMSVLTIINSLLMIIMIITALLTINTGIAFTAFIGFGGIYFLVVKTTKARLYRDSQRISHESNQVIKALQEGLGGIRDVLIDGTQSVYCDIYQKADIPLRRAQANITIIGTTPRFGIEALGMVLIAILALSLAGSKDGLVTAIPVLGALALGAQRLLPIMQQAYAAWTNMQGAEGSLRDVLILLQQKLPDFADATSTESIPFQSSIQLTNLSFRYSKAAPWVLKSLNLTIPRGSRIGFIGSTGSGKSTLLDIVMGLLEPAEGSLSIDGVRITQDNHRNWQAHIAHVPQAIFLADSSIAENIAFGIPPDQIDLDRVRAAAAKAQIAQSIESWDLQYNTFVGERGIRLSGGQRQRIGIARALYKNADVIVFDEATSALDNETEQNVMDAIESLGNELTILIVAHRLTTLKKCTNIIELTNGSVSRMGGYKEIVGNYPML